MPNQQPDWNRILEATQPGDLHGTARQLGQAVSRLPPEQRLQQLDQILGRLLQQDRNYGLALMTLAEVDEPDLLEVLARRLDPLPGSLFEAEEAYLAELLRLVAAVPETAGVAALSNYLLQRPIGGHWHTVVWALWPRGKDLFGRAWDRFFTHSATEEWTGTILEPFLSTPAAIRVVRKRLVEGNPRRWRSLAEAIRRLTSRVTWLSEVQRSELKRTLE